MPEGPEIHRAADRLAKILVQRPLQRVELRFDALRDQGPILAQQQIESVKARGKALLIRFSGGASLYSHNQLYGRWYVKRRGSLPETNRSLRVRLDTETHSALLYSASEVDLLDDEGVAQHPYLAKLGPDVVDPETTRAAVIERLGPGGGFQRRQLASLLLDQSFLGGLGNYLRSEILFLAGLRPSVKPQQLDEGAREILADLLLAIPRRSYALGGVTVHPERLATLKARGVPRRLHRHYVFNLEGRPCPSCGAEIERQEAGGRRVYVCSSCQRGEVPFTAPARSLEG